MNFSSIAITLLYVPMLWLKLTNATGGLRHHRHLNKVNPYASNYVPVKYVLSEIIEELDEIMLEIHHMAREETVMEGADPNEEPPVELPYFVKSDFVKIWDMEMEAVSLQIRAEEETLDLIESLGGVPNAMQDDFDGARKKVEDAKDALSKMDAEWKKLPSAEPMD